LPKFALAISLLRFRRNLADADVAALKRLIIIKVKEEYFIV